MGEDGPRAPPGPEAGTNSGPESVLSPLDQIFQRVSHISAEAFITDFVRQAIEAGQRSRGNPPASQFGIDHLKETTLNELSCEACTVCQDVLEKGSVVLTMPCGHYFHKSCLMPWLAEHNTCPVCRCEIESHCPRYNQQNFNKLKGELDAETVRPRLSSICPIFSAIEGIGVDESVQIKLANANVYVRMLTHMLTSKLST